MPVHILLVEDDVNLSADIQAQLRAEGFAVETTFDGLIAERLLFRNRYDLVILDINIPGKNGYEVCRSFRSRNTATPVIMLTAFGEVEDKLEGFEKGADDYLTKPFYFRELLARIKVLLKRNNPAGNQSEPLVTGNLEIYPDRKQVLRAGRPVRLTAKEYDILVLLAREKGRPVSKRDLMKQVWGTSVDVNTNTVEVFINSLRNKIDRDHTPKLLHTRTGFGYYLAESSYEA